MKNNIEKRIPLVCVGMPVYNGAIYIREALDSLLSQTLIDFELIISDNASTDDTSKICKEYENKDDRIKYVQHLVNMGSLKNFNYVLNESKSKYFTWLACDDKLLPDFLEKTTYYLEQFEDVVACSCDFKVIDHKNELIRNENLTQIYHSKDWQKTKKCFFENPISNVYLVIYGVFRSLELKKSGIQVTTSWLGLNTATEIPFLSRVASLGKIVSLPQILRLYRIHEDSVYNIERKNKKLRYLNFIHLKLIRFEQIFTLFRSNFKFLDKLNILMNRNEN